MQKKLTVLFAFAIFVLVVGWAITPAQAHIADPGEDCPHTTNLDHKHCTPPGDPTPGGGAGGKDTSLIITFVDTGDLLSDDGSYIDKVDVTASADGHITLGLGKGNHDRQVQLNISCVGIDIDGDGNEDINKCDKLPPLDGGFVPVEGQVSVRVNPYKVNCPSDKCHNVFRIGTGNSELMSIQISFNEGLHIDVDSDIGGATAFDPGHCLSLLPATQRPIYLMNNCPDPDDCNVTVTAIDDDGDGKNTEWDIVADGVTALICQIGLPHDQFVIGQTTLTFGFNAVKK